MVQDHIEMRTETLKEVLVIGKESAGKSQLIASLSGRPVYASNFRGSTVACEAFRVRDYLLIDTPGILRSADTVAMRAAFEKLKQADSVLLVAPAAYLEEDLRDLLPLVEGKNTVLAVTFRDRVDSRRLASLESLNRTRGLPCVYLDARKLSSQDREACHKLFDHPSPLRPTASTLNVKPIQTRLVDRRPFKRAIWIKALCALIALLVPAIGVVWFANGMAEKLDPVVRHILNPVVLRFPYPVLTGDYGLLTMGPLLFIWAVPVVVLYAFVLAAYKASGLIDLLSDTLDPFLRQFGLDGRDLPRILMGYGCNVPAIIGTRSCSTSSRGTCISAIGFGSACSYQFGATLGVFNAVHKPFLVVPYLSYLGLTTLIYARIISGPASRSPFNILLSERRTYLCVPRLDAIGREAYGSIRAFFRTALPVFFAITIIASLLEMSGTLHEIAGILRPAMMLFGLPPEASLGVLMASVRKDGLLLLSRTPMNGVQTLTAVYLAGVMLPCIVTLLTIAQEQSWKFALRMVWRQMVAASFFSMVLAWTGRLF